MWRCVVDQRGRLLVSVAVLGWVGVGAYGVWEMAAEEAGDAWQRPYLFFTVSLVLAVGATTAVARSYLEPLDRPRLRVIGSGVAALAVASAMVAWAIPLWATLLALSCVLAAIGAQRPARAGLVLLVAAPVVGMAGMFLASAAELGREDSYGDYPAAFGVGNATIAAGCLIGLAVLRFRDRRFASEATPQQRRHSPATV
jgi:hypothetical protein